MAQVKIKNIPQLKGKIKDLFEEIRKDTNLLNDIGVKSVELTQKFNRAGKSPKGNKHPELSDKWIDKKEELRPFNKVSDYYKSGASNVTFTGELLRSIVFKIMPSKGSVVLNNKGQHKPYKDKSGPVSKSVSNDKLVEYLKDQGRNIYGLNKQMENVINKIVRSFINKKIRSKFNLK